MLDMANYCKVVYQYIGDNLFTDGSAEGETWTQQGTPSTFEFSTTWFSQGTESCHVVTDAADEGAYIEEVTIVAGRSYILRVSAEIESGTWTVHIRRSDNDETLAQQTAATTDGNEVMSCRINDSNEYAGNVYVIITASAAGAEAYFDAAVFQLAPYQKQTGWYSDTVSEAQYGRIERILVEAGRTDEDAISLAQREIYDWAWPRTLPPSRLTSTINPGTFGNMSGASDDDTLKITFAGYVFALGWKHVVSTGGTAQSDTHITDLIGEADSDMVALGKVETNTMTAQVDQHDPITLWDAIEEITLAGSGSDPWQCGIYPPGYNFVYESRPTDVEYQFLRGQVRDIHGTYIKPWMVHPGLCRISDMPVVATGATGRNQEDPRNVWIKEVEFQAPDQIILVRDEQ